MLVLLFMQTKLEQISPTKVKLTISSDSTELSTAHKAAVSKLGVSVKVPGFRQGKAPSVMVEKYLDPNSLAQEALEIAVNTLYTNSLINEQLRPVNNPSIEVLAYVPLQKLDFLAEVDVVGEVKLPKYTGLAIQRETPKITPKEINEIIDRLRNQIATRVEIKSPAKKNNEVVIDFNGTDPQTGLAIPGADGTDYPLILGSNTFIPGFEDQLLAVKPNTTKDFVIRFPKDYGVKTLRNKEVKFSVHIKQINEIKLPPIDDANAKLLGNFNSVAELKADIKKELKTTKENDALTQQQNKIVETLVNQTEVAIPQVLIDDEKTRLDSEYRQNAAYSGLTWSEYLTRQGLSEDDFTKSIDEQAKIRIKTGLVLGAIANQENLHITKEELSKKIKELKNQYAEDKQMIEELNKPENQQDIQNRLLVEKTVNKLVELNS